MKNDSVPQESAKVEANLCSHCKKEIPAGAKKCPFCQSDLREWWNRHPVLTGVIALFILGSVGSAVSGSSSSTGSAGTSQTNDTPQLQLLSYGCSTDYGYFHITGQVKNIAGQSLKNVEAVGTAYAKDGTFINSDSALIEYNPILPDQTSPFEVLMTDNPAMQKCNVDFKFLMGGSVPTQRTAPSGQ